MEQCAVRGVNLQQMAWAYRRSAGEAAARRDGKRAGLKRDIVLVMFASFTSCEK